MVEQLGCNGNIQDVSTNGNIGGNSMNNNNDTFRENVRQSNGNFYTPRERVETTIGMTEKVKIGCGTIFITVNYDEDGICEVFTNLGRAGGCPSQSEATARVVSIALRSGVSVQAIIDQLKGIRCLSTVRQKGLQVLSCPDAIGKVIEKVYKSQSTIDSNNEIQEVNHKI